MQMIDNYGKNHYSWYMKQPRVKGQALALVLIVIVVSVIIAFSITSRVVQDIRQQGEEKASTRAETIAETAIENLTLKIQSGDPLTAYAGASTRLIGVSTTNPSGGVGTLDLCDPTSTDVTKQCAANSVAQEVFFKQVIQFKVFDGENLEVFMASTASTTPVELAASRMIVHIKTDGNGKIDMTKPNSVLIKGYYRKLVSGQPELRLLSECVYDFNAAVKVAHCLPAATSNYMKITPLAHCPSVPIDADPTDTKPAIPTLLGDNDQCFQVEAAKAGYGVSFYRIKPILAAKTTDIPYIDVSATGAATPAYELPVPQMVFLNAGVYTGSASASDQQVFQQGSRLILLNKSVPEVADYVLYNGSGKAIKKSY